ncbi:adenine phosphoribosyltransferase [Pristis pectinata]|uniref:adenine phosphoribosyltransferase n=1 Tax=Pristis pectinata TaxID=685728 RepID=UPI00223D15D3|nr:adenine phosphoribosyltransferase [Pristis pectinata]XP_051891581.1 adenine phosphoribosyltransferase [Pristis pectinata]XP_051891582.1 adenine phosphoribosyltransferase [Pristis pectinata]XP_051891583.1 adenine phosphoribosyltransferase [Pristis pectinata]
MDVLTIPPERAKGWYLAFMAPNVKGPPYAWLDPSRLYCNQQAFKDCVEDLIHPFQNDTIDIVAGIDAMGFVLGAAIAHHLGKGFLTIRKEGHLCVETKSAAYSDYTGRQKVMEMRSDVVRAGLRILLVDQWVETGGTMETAINLIEQEGGTIAGIAAICIEDTEGGRKIKEKYKCSSCVPELLQPQFNNKYLESFKAFEAKYNKPK